MTRSTPVWALASFLVISAAVAAASGLPDGKAVEETVATSTVERIDLSTRDVTLKGVDGRLETMRFGPEARNLEQLHIGDVVTITYTRTVAIFVSPPGTNRPTESAADVQRAPMGGKPGGKVTNVDETAAVIEAVDRANRTVTVRGPGGPATVKMGDDVDLERVRVGDQVLARYTDAVSISVATP